MHTILKKVSFRSHPHMFTRARERGTVSVSASVCVCAVVFVCAYLHASALKSRRCCCAAVANKFVKLHSEFAVFLCSGVTSGATNKETPQYVSWSPQSTTARPLAVPLSLSLSPSLCLVFFWYFAPVCHCDSFYTFHFIVTYAFIS